MIPGAKCGFRYLYAQSSYPAPTGTYNNPGKKVWIVGDWIDTHSVDYPYLKSDFCYQADKLDIVIDNKAPAHFFVNNADKIDYGYAIKFDKSFKEVLTTTDSVESTSLFITNMIFSNVSGVTTNDASISYQVSTKTDIDKIFIKDLRDISCPEQAIIKDGPPVYLSSLGRYVTYDGDNVPTGINSLVAFDRYWSETNLTVNINYFYSSDHSQNNFNEKMWTADNVRWSSNAIMNGTSVDISGATIRWDILTDYNIFNFSHFGDITVRDSKICNGKMEMTQFPASKYQFSNIIDFWKKYWGTGDGTNLANYWTENLSNGKYIDQYNNTTYLGTGDRINLGTAEMLYNIPYTFENKLYPVYTNAFVSEFGINQRTIYRPLFICAIHTRHIEHDRSDGGDHEFAIYGIDTGLFTHSNVIYKSGTNVFHVAGYQADGAALKTGSSFLHYFPCLPGEGWHFGPCLPAEYNGTIKMSSSPQYIFEDGLTGFSVMGEQGNAMGRSIPYLGGVSRVLYYGHDWLNFSFYITLSDQEFPGTPWKLNGHYPYIHVNRNFYGQTDETMIKFMKVYEKGEFGTFYQNTRYSCEEMPMREEMMVVSGDYLVSIDDVNSKLWIAGIKEPTYSNYPIQFYISGSSVSSNSLDVYFSRFEGGSDKIKLSSEYVDSSGNHFQVGFQYSGTVNDVVIFNQYNGSIPLNSRWINPSQILDYLAANSSIRIVPDYRVDYGHWTQNGAFKSSYWGDLDRNCASDCKIWWTKWDYTDENNPVPSAISDDVKGIKYFWNVKFTSVVDGFWRKV